MVLSRQTRTIWPLYVMVLPGVVFLLLFRYIPLLGSVIAFQDYSVFRPLMQSPFVGFKHFILVFSSPDFIRVLGNTLVLALLGVLFLFPIPIILSLMINEVGNRYVKKTIQAALNIPHFLSWVIIGGLTFDLFASHGLFNIIRGWLGLDSLLLMQHEQYFRPVYVFTALWREAGWHTIVYLAAMSAIDPQIYESAMVDGASPLKQMVSITLPLLMPTAVTLLLLQIGSFLQLGFDQVFNLLTPMSYSVGDIIDTFVYRTGVLQARYSYATAIGMFQSVVGLTLVLASNALAKKFTDEGLW
ncbi:MAG: ABC transporter permease subunit [Spirochaetaceae bacterium]|nr:ABC transporter permease subunit [Spirochaetaceae bacterium]